MALLFFGWAGLACNSESTAEIGSSGTEAGTGTGTDGSACQPGEEQVDQCCCFDDDPLFPSCSSTSLCSSTQMLCPDMDRGDCPTADVMFFEGTNLDCHLQAIVDGEIGELRWRKTGGEAPGFAGLEYSLFLAEDGEVVLKVLDYEGEAGTVTVTQGAFPAEFDAAACLALSGAADQYGCLESGLNLSASTVCVDAERVALF